MRMSRFSDSQILAIFKQAKRTSPYRVLSREYGISSVTFYKWRAKFGGMLAPLDDGIGGTVRWKGNARLGARFGPNALWITMN